MTEETSTPQGTRTRPRPRPTRGGRLIQLPNVEILTRGLPRRLWQDLYHLTMTVSWPLLFAGFGVLFLSFNLLFAVLYYVAPGAIANLNPPGYLGAFFFSVETLATVGYGDMHPQSVYGYAVASCQIFLGMLYLAILAGVVFSRFSRPTARFRFANVGVVRPIDGKTTLMFRAANARQNVIVEASARLRIIYNSETTEGYRLRRIADLRLIRAEHPLFVLGWNLMHVIDETSPLASATPASLASSKTMFSLTLSGTDETTGQVLMGRVEYPSEAIRWNHSFRDVLEPGADGILCYDYDRFDDVEALPASESPPS